MGLKDRVRDYFISKVEVYTGADIAMAHLEALAEDRRRDLVNVTRQSKELLDARDEHKILMLTGKDSPWTEVDLAEAGLNDALLRVCFNKIVDNGELSKKLDESREGHLSFVARMACRDENVKRMPVMVYGDGKVLYMNRKFEKQTGLASYILNNKLRQDGDLAKALVSGEGYEVEYGKGRMVFTPRKKDIENVSVVYFLPKQNETIRNRIEFLRRKGSAAATKVYENLKGMRVSIA